MELEDVLWYEKPAESWNEALPLGNGRLGAMVFGGVSRERIQFNEDSLWSGGFRERNNKNAKENLEKIRTLLLDGEIEQAEHLARYTLSGTPEYQRVYQTLGDLELIFHNLPDEIQDYKRSLILSEALAVTSFETNGHIYRREVFVSAPADAAIIHLSTTCPEGMFFDARLIRYRMCDHSGNINDDTVFVDGNNGGNHGIGFHFTMSSTVKEGTVSALGEYLVFNGIKEAVIYLTAATTFREKDPAGFCQKILDTVKKISFEELKKSHVEDFQKYESRMEFHLETQQKDRSVPTVQKNSNVPTDQKDSSVPTDKRLLAYRETQVDLGLIELYFRYGRYLLISCSRPGSLPANLQGIWCQDFLPAWDSKYTININTEMNYWPAECCNLSECHEPLFELLKRMHENGAQTARQMYGARGFAAHHNTDIWGDTAPQDTYTPASYWVMGAAWLCLHIWEHYEYSMDKDFLQEHFNLLQDACYFFVDYLIENEQGELVVCPTVSPENAYILPNGNQGCLCAGCSMDSQILHELFSAYFKACRVLNMDTELADILEKMLAKLPKIKIGKQGNIQEWIEDYEEVDSGHRHISHLFALFPGSLISKEETPELAAAAKETLERRLSAGGGHTGWSRAWIINFWARLGEGDRAAENINLLLKNSTLPNLFDNHPPFQIDGNFGGTAGIVNMLVYNQGNIIHLLYALPKIWPNGYIKGVKAKGGLIVDIEWKNCSLHRVKIKAEHIFSGTICYRKLQHELNLEAGDVLVLDAQLLKSNTPAIHCY